MDPLASDEEPRFDEAGFDEEPPAVEIEPLGDYFESITLWRRRGVVPTMPSAAGEFDLQPGPPSLEIVPEVRWVPLGESITFAGLTLPGGLYFGSGLLAIDKNRGIEPALVDPGEDVNLSQSESRGLRIDYWSYYSDISPEARGAYLNWLQAGRVDDVQIGYVFLFFYGIERRVLNDAVTSQQAREEVPELLRETERLLELYDHSSFQRYATNLHAAASFGIAKRVSDLRPPTQRIVREELLAIELATRGLAVDGKPLPGEWALARARTDADISLRTPATRCPEEFAQLFLARYADRHAEGLKLQPDEGSSSSLWYRPASPSFGGHVKLGSAKDLHPVARYSGHLQELKCLVEEVTDELAPYSRHVGRHGNRDSFRAIALLPDQLARDRASAALTDLLAGLPAAGHVVHSTAELAAALSCPTAPKLCRRDAVALASLLGALGIGIEPDMRHGGRSFRGHERVVLWREEQVSAPVSADFAAALALLQMGVAMSVGNGDSHGLTERWLSQLTTVFPLPPADRRRLQASLCWLLAEQPGSAGIKVLLRHVDEIQRELIARSLVVLTTADGATTTAQQFDTLRWLYGLLELELDPSPA
jgi:hypothetical protein